MAPASKSESKLTMLPHVQPKDRVVRSQGVLVLSRNNVEPTILEPKPSPSRSLNTQSSLIELGAELVKATKVAVDCLLETTVLEGSAALGDGGQVLPEERVVDVSTAIELDGLLSGDLSTDVLVLDRGGVGLLSGVCRRSVMRRCEQ